MENLICKKNKLPHDKALLQEYQNRYENDKINWFTDGGCRNMGKKNVMASLAIY